MILVEKRSKGSGSAPLVQPIVKKYPGDVSVPGEKNIEPVVHIRLVTGHQLTQGLQKQGKHLDTSKLIDLRMIKR